MAFKFALAKRAVAMLFIALWLGALKLTFGIWPVRKNDPHQPSWAHRRKKPRSSGSDECPVKCERGRPRSGKAETLSPRANDRPRVPRGQGPSRPVARLARLSGAVAHGWPLRHQEALSALRARPVLDHHQPRRLHPWLELHLQSAGGRRKPRSFLPFVAFGFIAWQFISQLVLDGCNVFIANGPIIQQLQAPLSIYIYQTIWRHLIILAHNLLIYVLIALLYGLWPSWQTLLVVPGIILVCINGVSIGMLLGTLCARFRDIPPIVQTITQMMFLLTPILWRPNQIPGRELFYLLNPFYYLVEIIRAPLEGRAPSLFVWTVVLAMTAAGFVVSLLFFSRFRNRIVYWL